MFLTSGICMGLNEERILAKSTTSHNQLSCLMPSFFHGIQNEACTMLSTITAHVMLHNKNQHSKANQDSAYGK